MQDIKIPDSSGGGSGRGNGDFVVNEIEDDSMNDGPSDMVRVHFDKFVNLVATHDFEEVMKRHADEDIIISTNLLADLANAHEEEKDGGRKLPVIFLVGVILGIVITYLLVR